MLLVSPNDYMPIIIREKEELKIEENELKEAFHVANKHNRIYSEVHNVFDDGKKKLKAGVSL